MGQTGSNQVRALREERGLSQGALAGAASLSRQSVSAIEAGRAVPAVDVALRLARALDCSVEELFGYGEAAGSLTAEPASPAVSGRVALAHVAGRWVAHPLDGLSAGRAADAVVVRAGARRVEVELLRTPADAAESIVLMGCAPALGLLADRLNGRRGPGRFLWLPRSSTQALQALAHHQAHVAGVHLVDEDTGEANVPDVRRHARRGALVVITLARWEAGLLTAPHNPKRIRAAAQLGRKGLRLVSREPGSGARRLLERELRRAGLPLRLLAQAPVQATGHLEVAQAVAHGSCDVGVATRDAALAFGLEFIPLAEERYDLALSADQLADPRLVRLLDMLSTAAFRRDLSSLGYDPQACGQRVAELRVA
ncbi:MAG: substrate-binding domain-containing protein [Polyangia bacterium]